MNKINCVQKHDTEEGVKGSKWESFVVQVSFFHAKNCLAVRELMLPTRSKNSWWFSLFLSTCFHLNKRQPYAPFEWLKEETTDEQFIHEWTSQQTVDWCCTCTLWMENMIDVCLRANYFITVCWDMNLGKVKAYKTFEKTKKNAEKSFFIKKKKGSLIELLIRS